MDITERMVVLKMPPSPMHKTVIATKSYMVTTFQGAQQKLEGLADLLFSFIATITHFKERDGVTIPREGVVTTPHSMTTVPKNSLAKTLVIVARILEIVTHKTTDFRRGISLRLQTVIKGVPTSSSKEVINASVALFHTYRVVRGLFGVRLELAYCLVL